MGSVISIDRKVIQPQIGSLIGPQARNLKFYLQSVLSIRHGFLYQKESPRSGCDGLLQSDYRTSEFGASLTCFYCTKCGTVEAWLDPTLHDAIIGEIQKGN